jgi:hypothetical protein
MATGEAARSCGDLPVGGRQSLAGWTVRRPKCLAMAKIVLHVQLTSGDHMDSRTNSPTPSTQTMSSSTSSQRLPTIPVRFAADMVTGS